MILQSSNLLSRQVAAISDEVWQSDRVKTLKVTMIMIWRGNNAICKQEMFHDADAESCRRSQCLIWQSRAMLTLTVKKKRRRKG